MFFKCKMCGGTLEFENGATIGVCDSCGTKQTLPRLDDDRRANLSDRANHFRRNNEFDKAAGLYEQILNEDPTDAEAYWSLVLCRYGIEYVEDPATHKRVPTINRTQFTSIYDDEDYKSALKYAGGYQRSLYEEEASTINEIQKSILAISQKEDPFDVFICYKESDSSGRRTQDSVLANDLYHQLTNEGFKVFFSRITLEDKLGTAYEPYIFAALNSSKVMVVLGTKPEYFNAVWVKNEWSRYLALVNQSGGKKVLIPAYRDMDPYDLPEEFSHLQAQDMSKLGFMQDLIRGIKKIAKADEPKQTPKETVVIGGNANVAPLLKRAFMFLEDGEWNRADDFCEQVLNQEPENAQAYLGKLMAELHVRHQEDLPNCEQPFDNSNNFQKAVRFGGEKLAGVLSGYIDYINERNENTRLTDIYNSAVSAMKSAKTESSYKAAAAKFKKIPEYKDADSLAEQCLERAEICRKDAIYDSARSQMTGDAISGYEAAIETFSTISGWKDADEQIYACQRKIEEIKAKEEAERQAWLRQAEQKLIVAKKRGRIIAITTLIVGVCIAFLIVLINVIIPKQKYNKAMSLLDSGDYDSAYALLEELGNSDAIASSKYDRAMVLIDSGDYAAAWVLLNGINYKDSSDKAIDCVFQKQKAELTNVTVGSTIKFGIFEQDNNTSNGKEEIEWIVLSVDSDKALVISKYALASKQYNNSYSGTTWEKCSLRPWLNRTFYYAAFGEDHQEMIISSTISADPNPTYDTNPGQSTTDKVFLLSIPEVYEYCDQYSLCEYTEYCYANSTYKGNNAPFCNWWLRSPGNESDKAAEVDCIGRIDDSGRFAMDIRDDENVVGGVRPAMWIELE